MLFRIAQEALTNVAKHAQATQVTMRVATKGETVHLTISDDGIGFDPLHLDVSGERRSWGIITMSERAEAVGGHYHIKSRPQQGTQIVIEVAR